MREYIENLTNNLIGRYNFDEMWEIASAPGPGLARRRFDFVAYLRKFLMEKEVAKMSYLKLGEIICSIEQGEMGYKTPVEIPAEAKFPEGISPEISLRHLVAHCLAMAIWMRLWPEAIPLGNKVKPYKMKRDEMMFVCLEKTKRSRDGAIAIFISGSHVQYIFSKRDCEECVKNDGGPIWQQVIDNWPQS